MGRPAVGAIRGGGIVIHDKYRKKYRAAGGTSRLRHQIALEAARRLIRSPAPSEELDEADRLRWIEEVNASELYLAKRKAAAVLGHRIRQGDLPSDSEVREQAIGLIRSSAGDADDPSPELDDEDETAVPSMAEHLDRFTIYKLRLQPLESVKQNPKYHPEGDALYHSLQVFELARRERPYDEEFLLAALLHDVGKGMATDDHVAAAVEALRGAVTERTLWLIEHHMDLLRARTRPLDARLRREHEASEFLDDLVLLRKLDDAGRVPGEPVGTIDEALEYLRGLEREDYLDD
jgi:predicted HD phosphohydrolase